MLLIVLLKNSTIIGKQMGNFYFLSIPSSYIRINFWEHGIVQVRQESWRTLKTSENVPKFFSCCNEHFRKSLHAFKPDSQFQRSQLTELFKTGLIQCSAEVDFFRSPKNLIMNSGVPLLHFVRKTSNRMHIFSSGLLF